MSKYVWRVKDACGPWEKELVVERGEKKAVPYGQIIESVDVHGFVRELARKATDSNIEQEWPMPFPHYLAPAQLEGLRKVIIDWFDANIPQPIFYTVKNMVGIEYGADYEDAEESEKVGTEEGEICGRSGCGGIIGYQPVKGCTCFISSPCPACVDNPLACPKCGWTEEK